MKFTNPVLLWLVLTASLCVAEDALTANQQIINIFYLTQEQPVQPALSNLDPFIQGKGMAGAEMATADNNTTGQFTGQQYHLTKLMLPVGADLAQSFTEHIGEEFAFVVVNLDANNLLKLADLPIAQQKLIFDASTSDDALRNAQCRTNVFHLLPSRAMRADALAQYMAKKRWRDWFLVVGPGKADQLYAQSIKRAAKRFGMKLVAEKNWTHTYDARRTAQSDVPVFTQDVDYDVLVVADEQGLFGEYLDYRTWIPRPVIGTQGLVATAWHRTHEQWGAVQMQNRFKEQTGRWMTEPDYGAYLAVRAIGEATVRTKSTTMQAIKDYLLSDQFALQGYKGSPMSFRSWDRQLRQPVLLAAPRSLVAVAPVEGFLHPRTELDTLGYDQPETQCQQGNQNETKTLSVTPDHLDRRARRGRNRVRDTGKR